MPVILEAESLCTPLVSAETYLAWKNSGSHDEPETAPDTGLIELALCAATAWLQSAQGCGRSFTLEENVTKTYLPYKNGVVDVIDLVRVDSIALDTTGDQSYATTLSTGDYVLYPYNDVRYQEVRSTWNASRSITAGQYVRILGDFGHVVDGQVPPMIRLACCILTSRYYERRLSPFGVLQAPELGRFATLPQLDPDVEQLIAPYRRGNLWVVV